ncbi:FtsX-like permease family protein, partial [Streptomyces sp. NPDC002920]
AALDRSRIRLVSGTLPGPAPASRTAPVPVALPEAAADRLGLRAGARVELTDRLSERPLTVRVTGVYRPADTSDPYWQADALGGHGVRTVVFTTYGPLLADASVLASTRISADDTTWVATADYRTLTTDGIAPLRAANTRAAEALRKQLGEDATVRTELPDVLDRTSRALLVSRSTLLIVSVQLVLLAGYTLLLVARLLDAERAGETGLLRARGASRGRIAGLAALEALLLAVPAAVCAALLAGPLTRLLARWSSLDRAGLRLDTTAPGRVWLVAGGVAATCAVAVVAPALTTTANGPIRLRRVRAATSAAPVRAGADIGLLLIAGVAYWQLDRQTGGLSRDAAGGLGIDPLLVVAPSLALLAGTVLTLRLLPPAAWLAERWSARGRGLPGALAGWQFSRRPLRGAGPVLLLVVAVSTGLLAIGHGASWDRSQNDQADFRAGASVRVLDNRPGGPGETGSYADLRGARDAAPANRSALDLSGGRTATVLALDTAHADERLLLRRDLAGEPPAKLLSALAPPAPDADRAVRLPDGTRRLALDVRIGDARSDLSPRLTVVVEDRYGIAYRLAAGRIPVDGRVHRVALDLDVTATGRRAAPAGPLRLTGLQLDGTAPVDRPKAHRFTVERLLATGADGAARTVPAPAGLRWAGGWTVTKDGETAARTSLEPAASQAAPLSVEYGTGVTPAEAADYPTQYTVRVDTEGAVAPKSLSAVATRDFLRAAGAKTGDSIDVPLSGEMLRVRIVRVVEELPTTGDGDGGALLVDLRAVDSVLAQRASAPLTPNEWWVSTAPGKAAEVADALRARPDVEPDQVLVRDEFAAESVRDPLGAGPRAALTAVAVAAVALAAGGFAVSAAGARRERSAEFAVLRALGAPRRDLARLVATEQSLLVGAGLLAGLGLGTVLTRAVVPLIVLTSDATRPVPPVLVELPLSRVALLLAGVAVPLLLITAASALRRAEPAVALRHQGED